MRINIPLYVHQQRVIGVDRITVAPLFHLAHSATGTDLGRTIHKLGNQLRAYLGGLARGTNHQNLVQWNHSENLSHKTVKLKLDLTDSTSQLKLLLVIQNLGDRRVVFSPSLPSQWFEWTYEDESQTLDERATEFFENYFRAIRKHSPEFNPDSSSIRGRAWIDSLELDIPLDGKPKKQVDPLLAMLGGEDVTDGASELRKVGRCLNHIDPHDLARPIGVDESISRLRTLLNVGDRRGVVLVGPSGSGKSARIEGAIRQMPSTRSRRLTWQLSPSRLISGMSYLGQWQQRVLAILKHAHQRDHILYFDDLLGLLEAGKTRDSSMCVADMMRTQLETHPVRILAEMTAEAWAIFRRRDPKLASRLVVMPVAAMDQPSSIRTMLAVRQQIEARYRCAFKFETIPEWAALHDRFESGSVMPGKAIRAMHSLAAKMPRQHIDRFDVLKDFSNRTGLRFGVIDRNQVVSRGDLLQRIRGQLIGQDSAVNALVERAMIATTRLNDRSRPLGTYLLVGPTGVGKTELAKAVASCLFDDGGLIRMDMNELSSPGSASRLIGTFDAPDGLLTAAVRRRPHAVLLLDEIEKAHPSVLDVLLPALGEARLTDARGRTVDLSGLLILMTSNLGTQHSVRPTGFLSASDQSHVRQRHNKAIGEYFRPEFFNRIDDVLHFEPLSTETIQKIAKLQFRRLLQRDGLQRRKVLIDIDPNAIRDTAARGVDPRMGARSLKRQIERELIRPASETLAAHPSEQPVLLRMRRDTSERNEENRVDQPATKNILIECLPIEFIHRSEPIVRSTKAWSDVCEPLLQRADEIIDPSPMRYEAGAGIDTAAIERMSIRESAERVRAALEELQDAESAEKAHPQVTPVRQPSPASRLDRYGEPNPKARRQDFTAYLEIQEFWQDQLEGQLPGELEQCIKTLRIELGRLQSQLKHLGRTTEWLVSMRWFGDLDAVNRSSSERVASESKWEAPQQYKDASQKRQMEPVSLPDSIETWLRSSEGLSVTRLGNSQSISDCRMRTFTVTGALASASVAQILGGWMMATEHGQSCLFEVAATPLANTKCKEGREDHPTPEFEWNNRILPPIQRILHARDGNTELLAGYRTESPSGNADYMTFLDQSYSWSSAKSSENRTRSPNEESPS